MKLTHLTALGLCATALGAAYGCSSPEAERQPIYVNANSGGTTGTTGGKAGTGGSMQAMTGTGGKVINVGSGGASGTGGNKAVGTGGTPAATGGTSSGAGGGNNNNTGGKSGGTGGGNTGGGNNANTGGGGSMDCTTAEGIAAVLEPHMCATCHNGGKFTTAAGLMGQIDVADADYAMCGSGKIIVKKNSAMSVLVQKLKGLDMDNCMGQMPDQADGATLLSAGEISCVEQWINGLQ